MASSKMEPATGIYLGTEYSCVRVWRDGRMEIIANNQGNMTTPSCVPFMHDRQLIGEAAEIQADRNPTNTIFDMNCLIGRRFSDPTVLSDRKLWPFNVIEGADDKPKLVVEYRGEEKQFYPEELSSMILAKMKKITENFLDCIFQDAVVIVRAYFNDSQRWAMRNASGIAGINSLRIDESVMMNYCTPQFVAIGEIGNANKKRVALQRELSDAKKLTEKLMCEKDDAKRLSKVVQKVTQQLMSEREDATRLSEAAQKQLMCERDEATKLSEAVQKLTEQLMSEKDHAKKHSEAAQKLIEQLISERDYAIKQVEELRWLTEQQAPGRKCLGCFIGYSYSELQHATDNFHESFKLGEGGFGKVYKGILHNTTIAIKILNEGSSQGAKEFHQEVEVLSKLQHPNLVKLIGACAEIHALIYEYLQNGSLEDRLRCKNNTSPLSWQARVRIAFEICSALSFLHSSKPHGIVHGDLKPDNVLLDLNNVSKLSDFGLCHQLNWTTNASRPFYITDCPKGTFGYIDPEYFTTAKMTPQNDVYSFGIMLLQLVTCKDPRGIRQLVEEAHRKGTLKALIDVSAGPWPFKEAEKMISLGLRCSDIMRIKRPDLSTVVWKEIKSMADVASASQSSWAASLFHR